MVWDMTRDLWLGMRGDVIVCSGEDRMAVKRELLGRKGDGDGIA